MAIYTTREEHPLPAVLLHGVHVLSMLVLIATGLYIHRPFLTGAMGAVRSAHFVAMFALLATTVARVYWAFFGRGSAGSGSRRRVPDWTHFAPEAANKGQLLEMAKYYLFLRPTHPRSAKYNALQKGDYVVWLLLIALQALTGFALWAPTAPTLLPLTYAFGGPAQMRVDHYLVMWLFIVTVMVHVYLAIAEGAAQLPLMFLWRETRPADEERT